MIVTLSIFKISVYAIMVFKQNVKSSTAHQKELRLRNTAFLQSVSPTKILQTLAEHTAGSYATHFYALHVY